MQRGLGILAAALVAATPVEVVTAAPCTLAAKGDPCDADVGARSDRTRLARSPWLDEAPPPPWMAPAPPGRDHRLGSMLALGGIYASFTTWMYFAWYHDQPRLSGFLVGGDGYFGERSYAGGADKLGHAWANLALTRGGAELLRWGGWSRGRAAAISAGLSWSLFLFVEIKDGFYYQFSPGDLEANTVGALLGAAQVRWPALDRLLDLRVAYWPSPEYRAIVNGTSTANDRVNSLNIAEDYSGETYFLAVHLAAVPRPAATPRWLGRALDYVDVGVGFQSTKYKPDPPDDPPYRLGQQLFLGATLDLQRVVDRALAGRRGRGARVGRAIGHGLLEVLSPPFSIARVGVSRSVPSDPSDPE